MPATANLWHLGVMVMKMLALVMIVMIITDH
jgi:hypothetical protein